MGIEQRFYVGAGSIIMSDVSIGDNTIIYSRMYNRACCMIGNHCTIAPSVRMAGRVQISNNVSLGIGTTIIDKIKINNGVIIGAGSLVINNIFEENEIVYGIPAASQSNNSLIISLNNNHIIKFMKQDNYLKSFYF